MGFVASSIEKDLRRRLADPLSLVIWLGIPFLLGVALSLFSGDGPRPKARVLLVDQDDSFLSSMLAGGGAGELGDFLEVEPADLPEARRTIAKGDASAVLILPDDWPLALLEEEPVELRLITNPSQTIAPRIVEEGLEILVELAFYVQRILGQPLREMARTLREEGGPLSDEGVAAISVQINERMRRVSDVLFPPLLSLRVEPPPGEEEGSSRPGFGLLFLPGLLFMALLFVAQGMSEDLWKEKDQGTLRRAAIAPHGLAGLLAGKLGASAVLMALVAAVSLALAAAIVDVELVWLPLALVWCVFAGLVLLCLFFLVQVYASSQRGGNLLTTAVMFPLLMLGGSFFPMEGMPAWMVRIGSRTPNGAAVVQLKAMLRGDVQLAPLVLTSLALLALGALLGFLVVRRMRTHFAIS